MKQAIAKAHAIGFKKIAVTAYITGVTIYCDYTLICVIIRAIERNESLGKIIKIALEHL